MIRIGISAMCALLVLSCAGDSGNDGRATWYKSTVVALEFVTEENARTRRGLERAERWLDEGLGLIPERDARYPVTLVFLGLIQRAKEHQAEADSLITLAVDVADTSLRANRWELSGIGRWWIEEILKSGRRDVWDALEAAREWRVAWQSILDPGHPDIAVLTGCMAIMEQLQGRSAASDSLYAETIAILDGVGPTYERCARVFRGKRG